MFRPSLSLQPDASVPKAYFLMKNHHKAFLPVVKGGVPVGIITWEGIKRQVEKYQAGTGEAKGMSVQMSMLSPVSMVSGVETLLEVARKMLSEGSEAALLARDGQIQKAFTLRQLMAQIVESLASSNESSLNAPIGQDSQLESCLGEGSLTIDKS